MIVRLVDNKALSVEDHDLEDEEAQDHRIDRDDMQKLIVFYTAPLRLTAVGKPAYRMALAVKEIRKQIESTDDEHMKESLAEQIEELRDMSLVSTSGAPPTQGCMKLCLSLAQEPSS